MLVRAYVSRAPVLHVLMLLFLLWQKVDTTTGGFRSGMLWWCGSFLGSEWLRLWVWERSRDQCQLCMSGFKRSPSDIRLSIDALVAVIGDHAMQLATLA